MSEPPEGYYDEPVPTWVKPCQECGTDVERYHGESDVTCGKCGAQYNAFGQRLRDDWRGNPSNYDDDIGDLEGYEIQHSGDA
jgi:hypothetical protein